MRKLIIAMIALVISLPALASSLPFVGQRSFTFEYDKDKETITITADGQTKIVTGDTHWLGANVILYQGHYQQMLPVNINGATRYYQINNNKVYEFDEDKQPAEECGTQDQDGRCSADLMP